MVREKVPKKVAVELPPDITVFAEAKALNELLYSDVCSISESEMSDFTETMRTFSGIRGYSQEYTEAWVKHRFRLYLTLKWLETLIKTWEGEIESFEMGTESIVSDIFLRSFPRMRWQHLKGDVRYHWEIADQSVDLIVCAEVLEHLSDLPKGLQDSFRKTGLRATLKECYRVLKPGGCLFITTPNAASVVQLRSVLVGNAPWFYGLHVREYTIHELLSELANADFGVESWRAVHCLTIDQEVDYSSIFQMLLDYGFDTTNRGDDIFLTARKSSGPCSRRS